MCLVPSWDEFEDQGQRSKVKVTMDKNGILAISAALQFRLGKHFSLASSLGLFYVIVFYVSDARLFVFC